METDEFEISLSRELALCTHYVLEIERSLDRLEAKHGRRTEQVIADLEGGRAVDRDGELAAWARQHASLERWRNRKREYEALLRAAKRK